MIRKDRIRWVAKEDPAGEARFVGNLFESRPEEGADLQPNRRPISFLEFSQHNLLRLSGSAGRYRNRTRLPDFDPSKCLGL